jgi:hypothetical protein
MWEALEALNHDLERGLVGIVAAGQHEPARIRTAPGCPLPYFKASSWAIGEP